MEAWHYVVDITWYFYLGCLKLNFEMCKSHIDSWVETAVSS